MSQPTGLDQVTILKNRITDEIFFALGFGRSGFVRRTFGALFSAPALRFARIAARREKGRDRASGEQMRRIRHARSYRAKYVVALF